MGEGDSLAQELSWREQPRLLRGQRDLELVALSPGERFKATEMTLGDAHESTRCLNTTLRKPRQGLIRGFGGCC